jgi:hypothetical protein
MSHNPLGAHICRETKRRLKQEWRSAQERIEILTTLAQWRPQPLPVAQTPHTAVNIAALQTIPQEVNSSGPTYLVFHQYSSQHHNCDQKFGRSCASW